MIEKLIIRDGRIKFVLFYLILLSAVFAAQLLSPPEEQGSLFELGYVRTCLLMGFALGIDVMCATVGRFRSLDTWSKRFMWSYRTAAGHTVCPLLGVVACLWLASLFSTLGKVIGFVGFALIAFIYGSEAYEILGREESETSSESSLRLPALFRKLKASEWALVFAVSLDSLLSGSTQSLQTTGWTLLQAAGSFVYVGLTVGILGVIASGVACWLLYLSTRIGEKSAHVLAVIQSFGLFLEMVVIGYFGWHALLAFGIGLDLHWIMTAAVSLSATLLFFSLLGKRIWGHQMTEAKEAVSG